MATYLCATCDEIFDNDYNPAETYPSDTYKLLCPECYANLELEEPELEFYPQPE